MSSITGTKYNPGVFSGEVCSGKIFWIYEAKDERSFTSLIAMQPLVPDHAYMPHMIAIHVPFNWLYGSLICNQRLHSDRPEYWGKLVEVSQTPKHIYIIPISWTIGQIFISVDSPECPLSDEV